VLLILLGIPAVLRAEPGFPERWGRGDLNSPYSVANVFDGNQTTVIPIVSWKGRGLSLEFTLIHNAHAAQSSPFLPLPPLGNGWTHTYSLSITDNGATAILKEGDGRQRTYTASGGGHYTAPPGIYDTLVKNADNTFTLTRKSGVQFRFNTSNRLASIVDLNGNTLTLTWSGSHLTAIADPTGRQVSLTYNGSGYLTALTDPLSRSWQFTYSGNTPSQVTDPANRVWTFSYAQGRITSLTDRRGNSWSLSYTADTPPRISAVTNPLQGTRTYGYAPIRVINERGH